VSDSFGCRYTPVKDYEPEEGRIYNVVMLGAKGSGKSTFGNVLLGYDAKYANRWSSGHGCFEPSSAESLKSKSSHTKEPCKINGYPFYYDTSLPELTVVDTPGFERDATKNMESIDRTMKYLMNDVKDASLFIVMLNYNNFEWDLVRASLKMYELLLGEQFYKNVAFIVNFVPTATPELTLNIKRMVSQEMNKKNFFTTEVVNPFGFPRDIKRLMRYPFQMLYNTQGVQIDEVTKLKSDLLNLKKELRIVKKQVSPNLQYTTPAPVVPWESTLKGKQRKPLPCRFPVYINGRTIFEDSDVYSFVDMVVAAVVGAFVAMAVYLMLYLGSCVFCKALKREGNSFGTETPEVSPNEKSNILKAKLPLLSTIVEEGKNLPEDEEEDEDVFLPQRSHLAKEGAPQVVAEDVAYVDEKIKLPLESGMKKSIVRTSSASTVSRISSTEGRKSWEERRKGNRFGKVVTQKVNLNDTCDTETFLQEELNNLEILDVNSVDETASLESFVEGASSITRISESTVSQNSTKVTSV